MKRKFHFTVRYGNGYELYMKNVTCEEACDEMLRVFNRSADDMRIGYCVPPFNPLEMKPFNKYSLSFMIDMYGLKDMSKYDIVHRMSCIVWDKYKHPLGSFYYNYVEDLKGED